MNKGKNNRPQQTKKQPVERVNNCITSAWKERTESTHEHIMQQLDVMRSPDVVFLGDSLMERWKTSGAERWKELSSSHKILNAGIGGDKTQNVIWRLEKGLFEQMRPKVVFFMIGTNNIDKDQPKHVAAGAEKIIQMVHAKSPESKFITYGVLPKTTKEKIPVPVMDKIRELNTLIKEMATTQFADFMTYVDISERFLEEGSTDALRKDLFDDNVHINNKGYDVWYNLIKPLLEEYSK